MTITRAALIGAPGAAPRVGPLTLPQRGSGTTLLEVIAAPLNPLDLLIASGGFHAARHDQPYVPGSECVGVVLASDRFATGAPVYAECRACPTRSGAFATQVLVDDDDVLPLPVGIDAVPAAAVGNSGTAAYLSLMSYAELRAGEAVLMLGATGVVGQLAVQIARRFGAGRVVGIGRDVAVLRRVLELGADDVKLLPGHTREDLAARFTTAGGPYDVVLDGLYGLPLEAALMTCAPRARVVNVGNLSGTTAEIPAGLLRGKQLTVRGFAGLHLGLPVKAPALTWLWNALAQGCLHMPIRTFELDELPSAWQQQAQSPHAKYVVLPNAHLTGRSQP